MADDEHRPCTSSPRSLTGHHHHLICSTCGRVQDLGIPAELERAMDRTLDGLARQAGFAEVSRRLDLSSLRRVRGQDVARPTGSGTRAPGSGMGTTALASTRMSSPSG